MNCNTFFYGWDWAELAIAWNIYMPESYAGKDMYEYAEMKRNQTWQERVEDNKRTYGVIQEDGTLTEHLWSDMFGEPIDWSINDYENFHEYDPILWYINCAMKKYNGGDNTRVMRKMANDIRCFAAKLAESEISYLTPLWKGLSEIKSDWTVITIISGEGPLLAHMWD